MTTVVKRYLRAVNRSLPCEGAPKGPTENFV